MFWNLLLLVGAIVAIVWIVRGRRPAPPPPVYDQAPAATDWGRQPPPQAQQPGMGGQVMGGLATGLAIGAGALAAQEIGRHMLHGGDHARQGLGDGGELPHAGGSASQSSLAEDAGLGSVGLDNGASWDDGGGSFGSDDGGGSWDS
jgi:hypothetical protein